MNIHRFSSLTSLSLRRAFAFSIFAIALFAFAGTASAVAPVSSCTVNITNPVAGSHYSGIITIQWTYSGDCTGVQISFGYNSPSNDGNNLIIIGNPVDVTFGSITFDTTQTYSGDPTGNIEDASDYLIRAFKGSDLLDEVNPFTIDNTPPSINSVTTNDADGNGKIDQIIVEFNEDMDQSITNTSGFTVNGYSIGSNGTWTNGTTFEIPLTENSNACNLTDQTGCDTDATPNVSYSGGSLTDLAGNALNSYAAAPATDGAKPAMIGAKTDDTDNDGQIDTIYIQFSEDLTGSTVNPTGTDFELTDGYTPANGTSETAPGFVTLKINEKTTPDTGVTPTVSIADTQFIKDHNGNANIEHGDPGSSITPDDGAAPIAILVTYFNTNSSTPSDVDSFRIIFSEPVYDHITDFNAFSAAMTINANDLTDFGGPVNSMTIQGGGDVDPWFTVTNPSASITGVKSGQTEPTFQFNGAQGNTFKDAAGNEWGAMSSPMTMTDKAKPVVVDDVTLDSDSDGNVDTLELKFSEEIDDSTFSASDWKIRDNGGGANYDTFSGLYTDVSVLASDTDMNDEYLRLTYNPSNTSGTGVKEYSYTKGSSADNKGNLLEDITNMVATDGAGPAIVSAKSISTTEVEVTFSENIDDGSLNASDVTFDFADPNADGQASAFNTGVANDNKVVFTIAGGAIAVDENTGKVKISNVGDISDGTNTSSQTAWVTVNDGIAPSFVKAWEYDTDADGNIDEIVVEMNEAINDSTVTANDFGLDYGTVTGFLSSGNANNPKDTADNDKYITLAVNVPGTAAVAIAYNQGTLEDAHGNLAASTASIATDDQAAPVITINTPTPSQEFNAVPITLDIDTSEDANCKYEIDTQPTDYASVPNVYLMAKSGNGTNHTADISPSEDVHTAYFVCQDVSANQNESSVVSNGFVYDATPPQTTAVDAEDNKEVGQIVTITAQAADNLTHIASATYTITNLDDGTIHTGAMSATDGAFNSGTEGLTADVDTSGWTAGNYKVVVLAKDSAGSGNEETESAVNTDTFTLAPSSDTIAPNLNIMAVYNTTETSATVSFDTNEPGKARVYYGITTDFGNITPWHSMNVGLNDIDLGGLMCGTLYHIRVEGKDASGNTATVDGQFATESCSDTTAPDFTASFANVISSGFDVIVSANENFDVKIEVDDDSNFGSIDATVDYSGSYAAGPLTKTVSGLASDTLYYVRVSVKDAAGNESTKVYTQQTAQGGAVSLAGLSVSDITSSSATINWATDMTPDSGDYRIDTTPYAGTWHSMTIGGNSGTQSLAGLNPNTTYYYQVRFTKNGQTTYSTPMSFTTAASDTGISVDSIQAVKTYAAADDTYDNGWKWIFNITVNDMNETNLAMKFSQWVSGSNTLDAANNMRYSIDDANWTDITANGVYGADIDISGIDLGSTQGGRQVKVYVEMKVPVGTAGGSYSAQYGIQTN